MLYFQFVIVAAVFGGIAWVAAGRGGGIVDAAPDRPDVALPDDRQLAKVDIDAARFTVGWRGYRMDEVDRVLDRLAAEIDYRDRLIAELSGVGAAGYGRPVGYEPVPRAADRIADDTAGATQTAVAPAETTGQADPANQAGQQPGQGDPSDPSGPSDENSLSSWYRRPEPPA